MAPNHIQFELSNGVPEVEPIAGDDNPKVRAKVGTDGAADAGAFRAT